MITLSVHIYNTISQKIYNDIISSIPFCQLTCTCGHSGCLIGHGSYQRDIKVNGVNVPLDISRVLCNICGTTHALLLSSIVPYSLIPLADQLAVISDDSTPKGTAVMEHNPAIDENNVKSIIRQYNHHWRQRLLTERVACYPIHHLIEQCFSFFARQFMQIKNTPNILFLAPT